MWNNKPIIEMDTEHLRNTISLLERRAKEKYQKEADEVAITLDSYRAQAFEEKSWYDFLPDEYYKMLKELDCRPIDLSLNF